MIHCETVSYCRKKYVTPDSPNTNSLNFNGERQVMHNSDPLKHPDLKSPINKILELQSKTKAIN